MMQRSLRSMLSQRYFDWQVGMNLNTVKPRSKTGTPEELKMAVKRLSEISDRVAGLALRRIKTSGPPVSFDDMTDADLEREVRQFSEALLNFIRLRIRIVEAQRSMEKSLKTLLEAEDDKEISALIGPTLLADQKEYVGMNVQLTECIESKVNAGAPQVSRISKWAAEINDFSKWVGSLVERDERKGQDDLTLMIESIRDNDIKRFDKIYEKVRERIEREEGK